MTKIQKAMEGGKKNADSIGMSASVILAWLAANYLGVAVPEPVIAAAAGLISSVATNIKNGVKS